VPEAIEAATAQVPEKLRRDIEFAHANVKKFAEAQKATGPGFRDRNRAGPDRGAEDDPGIGGRLLRARRALQPHRQSAIMTVTTAKVAGCRHIVACSPPRPGVGIAPPSSMPRHICGADKILAMGGVQGVAAMTFGLFGLPKANILVGPGNQFVAEAKRILFGRVGIDMIAGPPTA
jgi:sulfopropanediol 3-dehydrogenase